MQQKENVAYLTQKHEVFEGLMKNARTFHLADSMPPAFLWPGATVGWVGAPKICLQVFISGRLHSQPAALKAA